MSHEARIEELKSDLARQLRGDSGTPRRDGRGREATHPAEIPPRGWKDVLWRAWNEMSEQNLFLIAGGVTYAILQQVGALAGVLPPETLDLLRAQLHTLAEASSGALGLGAGMGLVLALWSASRGMSGLVTAINIAYEEKERRGFFKLTMIALALTLALIIGGAVAIALIAVLPAAAQLLPLGSAIKWVLLIVQWPVLVVLVMLGLAVLYRYAPDRDKPQWRWVSPGAITATILWIVASIGFTVYVANFNSYDKTYGSLGGLVILLTWLYLSAIIVLLGAAINAQSERQTRHDSTEGPWRAMGQRDAHAADTLGASKEG